MAPTNLQPINDKGERHGYYVSLSYYENKHVQFRGNYVNDIRCGYWEYWSFRGVIYHREYKII